VVQVDPRVEVAELAAGDEAGAERVVRLLNRALGDRLYRTRGLLSDAADPTAGVWLASGASGAGAADVTGGTAGAAVARLLIPEDASYYERFGPDATALFASAVGSFEALAVDPAFRRRGIGEALTRASLAWMRRQGCDVAVTLSWLSGRPDSSPPLFRSLGFDEGRTVDRFYERESVEDDWSCPVCGQPCRCPATLFVLALH